MKIAIVHDYLNQFGGAERVVCELAQVFHDAPIYTSIYHPDLTWPGLTHSHVITSWMQNMPLTKRGFRALLPLYPAVFSHLKLENYDVVISSSSSFAKGIEVGRNTIHICYCYTPTRFLWYPKDYLSRWSMGGVIEGLLTPAMGYLKRWDLEAARKPDYFLAISSVVKERIEKIYEREAKVIYPSVNTHRFRVCYHSEDFYLIVSRLLPYKRIDIAVEAFNHLNLPLVIIGDGPARQHLQRIANRNITFTGYLSDPEVLDYFCRCRAFVFPGEEDFGIAPLEANACGKPVVAYRAGGALDTVIEGKNGLFFKQQTPECLAASILQSREVDWDPDAIRAHAEKFRPEVFHRNMAEFVDEVASKKIYRS